MSGNETKHVLKAYRREFSVFGGVLAAVIFAMWFSIPVAEHTLQYTSLSGQDAVRWGSLVSLAASSVGILAVFEAYRWFLKEVGVNYAN